MTKILVADDTRDVRELLADILADAGYEVVKAKNGGEALEIARATPVDLILLDVSMPVMNGFEVLRNIRATPGIEDTPVIMVTVMPPIKGELAAWRLHSRHYIAKPFQPEHVELAVRVALREAKEPIPEADEPINGQNSAEVQMESESAERRTVFRTGIHPLDEILRGGIPPGSLTVIEGPASSGKSVLCQQMTYESLVDGIGVAYFASDNTARGLATQMGSFGMSVSAYLRSGQLRVYPLKETTQPQGPGGVFNFATVMTLVAREVELVSSQDSVVIVDSITNLATNSDDRAIIELFSACKRLCDEGRSIILVTQPHAFDENMLRRCLHRCDAHIGLRVERVRARVATLLTVHKAHNAGLTKGNILAFEVLSGVGMSPLPFGKFKT